MIKISRISLARETYVENFERVAGRVEHSEKHDGEQYQHERLDVEEYEREEEVMTTVLDQQQRQEFLGEGDARQSLVEAKGGCRGIGN